MSNSCVIACSRPWGKGLLDAISAKTDAAVHFFTDPSELTEEALEAIDPQYVFFPHWSWIIPQNIWSKHECVIFHMTDLPFGRGGSPLQNLIVRNIELTQISALRCCGELDAGPIYAKRPLSLHGAAEEIFIRSMGIIAEMICDILAFPPEPTPQQGDVTVFKRRKPEESNLSTATNLQEMFDMIRMLDAEGYPHAFLHVGPFRLEFTRAAMRCGHVCADVKISLNEKE